MRKAAEPSGARIATVACRCARALMLKLFELRGVRAGGNWSDALPLRHASQLLQIIIIEYN